MKEVKLTEIAPFIKALHCPTRWKIIEFLQTGPKSSEEIYAFLTQSLGYDSLADAETNSI